MTDKKEIRQLKLELYKAEMEKNKLQISSILPFLLAILIYVLQGGLEETISKILNPYLKVILGLLLILSVPFLIISSFILMIKAIRVNSDEYIKKLKSLIEEAENKN